MYEISYLYHQFEQFYAYLPDYYQRYDGANKMQIEQHWVIGLSETVSYSSKEIGNNKNYEETTELEKWDTEILPEYWHKKGDGRLKAECHKTTDSVRKRPTEF